jgi:hypothetical protein
MVSKLLHNLKVFFNIERFETSWTEHEVCDAVHSIAMEEYLGLPVSRCQGKRNLISYRKHT